MFEGFTILIIIILYLLALYFITNFIGRKNSTRISTSAFTYALSISIYCTAWTYYGSIGMMANRGFLFLTIYIGPIIIFLFFNNFIEKIIRLKNEFKITSLADFLSTRYDKSARVAALVTILCVFTIIPYIAIQLKAIINSFNLITEGSNYTFNHTLLGIIIVLVTSVFTIYLGVRNLVPTERHEQMITVVAIESIVKLVLFLTAGIFIVFFVFDGIENIVGILEDQGRSLPTNPVVSISEIITWFSYIIVSMYAVIFLPRQFHVTIIENSSKAKIHSSRWIFILYLILINIFVIPIAYAGLASGIDNKMADYFLLQIPLLNNNKTIALLVFIGGFSAASSMIMIASMTLSTMISNHIIVPIFRVFKSLKVFQKRILQVRWILVFLIIFCALIFITEVGEQTTLIGVGMISFIGIFQLIPITIGAMFWENGTKYGAISGIIIGFVVWMYTLIFPLFIYAGIFDRSILDFGLLGIDLLRPEHLFGIDGLDNISNSVVWSLFLNSLVFFVVSKFTSQSKSEKSSAYKFIFNKDVERLLLSKVVPSDIEISPKIKTIRKIFRQYFYDDMAEFYLNQCLEKLQLHQRVYISIVELSQLQKEAEKVIAGAVGSAIASKEMKELNLFDKSEINDLESIYLKILKDLKLPPAELVEKIDYYKEKEELQNSHFKELEEKIREKENELKERILAENKLREAELKYRRIFENASEGIFQTSIEGDLLAVNPAVIKILGYDSETDLRKKIKNIGDQLYVNPNDRKDFLNKIVQQGTIKNFETQVYKKDSSIIWVSISSNLIKDKDGEILFLEGILIDFSNQKKTERELIRAKEKAEKADRLKSNFLAQMSHEIRTPINTILNFTTLVRNDMERLMNKDNIESFNTIELGANRLMRTIDLLLNYSEVEAGAYHPKFVDVDIRNEIINPILAEFRRAAEIKKLELKMVSNLKKDPILNIDQYTFSQIVANLVDNAIKYTEYGSVILTLECKNDLFVLNITDTGIGISEDYLPDLFEKFSQEESGYTRRFEGNGLGLALVKNYCKINNIDISVKSKKDKGSTFLLVFNK